MRHSIHKPTIICAPCRVWSVYRRIGSFTTHISYWTRLICLHWAHMTLLFLYCFGRNLMASLCRDWFWGNYRTTNYLYCIHTHFHRHSLFNVDDGFQIDLKPVFEDSQSWLFSVFECSQFWLFSVLTSNLEIFFQI